MLVALVSQCESHLILTLPCPVGMTEGLIHHDPVRPGPCVDPDHGHRFQREVDEVVAAALRYKRCRVGREFVASSFNDTGRRPFHDGD